MLIHKRTDVCMFGRMGAGFPVSVIAFSSHHYKLQLLKYSSAQEDVRYYLLDFHRLSFNRVVSSLEFTNFFYLPKN